MKKIYLSLLALAILSAESKSQTDHLFKDLNPGTSTTSGGIVYPTPSNPEGFFNAGSNMYFIARVGPSLVHQLWKTDGTPGNTIMLRDSMITTNLGDVLNVRADVNGTIFFTKELNGSSSSSTSTELWKTDGTPAGTVLITTLSHQQGGGSGGSLKNFTAVGNKLFFSMGQNNGRELWVSDGTAGGTTEVIDLAPGTVSGIQAPGVVDQPMIAYNGKLYFSGNTTTGNTELYSSDGTAGGTVLVQEINPSTLMSGGSDPSGFFIYNNELYFWADDGTSNSSSGLWKTDGTTTVKVFQNAYSSGNATLFKNEIFFSNGIDLWKSNGTTAGTTMVNDSAGGSIIGANNDYIFTVYSKFIPTPPYYNYYYWRSDGTTGGNSLITSYNLTHSISFDVLNNKMYIPRADSGSTSVYGLWQTDGTPAGTSKILTYGPGIHIFNNAIYFSHYDAAHGAELWVLDFAAAGIEDHASSYSITVYPNPSNGIFQLETGDAKILSVNVYNLLGKEVYAERDVKDKTIDLRDLSAGIYILQTQTTEGINSKKIMIQK